MKIKIDTFDLVSYGIAVAVGLMIVITIPKMQENISKVEAISSDIERIADSFEYYNERRF